MQRALVARGSAVLILALAVACARGPEPQRLDKAEIQLAGRTLSVEVARTPDQRRTGMMFRRALGADEGMLFVFPRDDNLAFYMKNTRVPLSIAFIRSDGVVDSIAHMEPGSLQPHLSRTPCRYALEMPLGWFGRNGVIAGARVVLPNLPAE